MHLSIIIVDYKTPELVKKCIESIKKTKPKISYEIIVIDNSVDNRGFAKANNIGIKKAKGKYILLLNSDTLVKPEAIDKLYDFARSREEDAGVVVPRLLNPDGSVQASVFRLPTIWRAIKHYYFGQEKLLDKYIPADTVEIESAVMAAFLITPKALKEVGLLNEKYFLYFEDLDYCRRIAKSRLKIYYLPEAEIIHLHGASGGVNKLLIESAKKYHGIVGYYIYTFILWSGQKLERLFK